MDCLIPMWRGNMVLTLGLVSPFPTYFSSDWWKYIKLILKRVEMTTKG